MTASTIRGVPTVLLVLGALLCLGLCGCLREPNGTPEQLNLGKYLYAVSVFNNRGGYNDRAEAALAKQGLIIIEADDPRLADPTISKMTLYCTFDMVTDGNGPAVRMIIRNDHGQVLFEAHARRVVELLSVDAVVSSLTPYRAVGAPPAPKPGTIIEM